MPKAFLLKKKPMTMGQVRSNSPKLFSPSSSGIGSPNSSHASIESLSPRNDENENRFEITSPKYSFEKSEVQGLDLSIKSLLKESNNSSGCQESTFVSSYPYPAKFAKIADFLRVNESSKTPVSSPLVPPLNAINCNIESKDCRITSLKGVPDSHKPINYSTTTESLEEEKSSNYQRMSPYSINWSEHFSVNKVVVSPTASSQRSDDSGRESFHSADDMDMKVDDNHNSIQATKNKKSERFHCPDCNKSYSTQSGLAKHQEFLCATQVKKSFSCKHCEKVYVSLGALKMHIRTHTLPCKCKLCGKAFSRPWLLQGHIRTHTGEKPFACQFCNRAFADRSNLRAHLQTHSVVKKYSCKTCSRTFSRMSLLLKHEDNGCNGSNTRVHHTNAAGQFTEKTSNTTMTLVPIEV